MNKSLSYQLKSKISEAKEPTGFQRNVLNERHPFQYCPLIKLLADVYLHCSKSTEALALTSSKPGRGLQHYSQAM